MNTKFSIKDTELKDVKIITPFYAEDERGYFLKDYERDIYFDFGICDNIYEEFESCSKKDVIRGLHFQIMHPQHKFVRVIKGEIMDVAVDLRADSETFGMWVSQLLSEYNHNIMWIPAGFAHGFLVKSEEAIVSYKCIGKYLERYDSGIIYDDKDINIDWNIKEPIISERDKKHMSFKTFKAQYKGL